MVRDMTAGSPSKILVTFALPMILGNVFQQLYNIVDSVVVGNFVGSDALAAVGASYPVTFLFIAVATGASIGCSVVISQFYGAKRITEMKSSVFTALTSMMTLSALLLLAGCCSRARYFCSCARRATSFPTRTPTCASMWRRCPSYFSTTPRRPPSTPSGTAAPPSGC